MLTQEKLGEWPLVAVRAQDDGKYLALRVLAMSDLGWVSKRHHYFSKRALLKSMDLFFSFKATPKESRIHGFNLVANGVWQLEASHYIGWNNLNNGFDQDLFAGLEQRPLFPTFELFPHMLNHKWEDLGFRSPNNGWET